ncbi:hypothetical protein GCM10027399_33170 [Curvibacter fontanus]|jgi:hypothetical protein
MPAESSTPRLLIFEGIMGSGKSTATRRFGELLAASGAPVAAFTEAADPHPVRASDDLADFFQPWAEIDGPLLAKRVREKWARYVQQRLNDRVFTVMDGQLFHGDLTNLFMMEAAPSELSEHTDALMRVLASLNPMVVYFRPADLQEAIREVFETRGPDWQTYQLRWKLRSPYATNRQLTGREGLATMYTVYRALTDSLFDDLDCPKLAIDTGAGEWQDYYKQTRELLEKVHVRV